MSPQPQIQKVNAWSATTTTITLQQIASYFCDVRSNYNEQHLFLP